MKHHRILRETFKKDPQNPVFFIEAFKKGTFLEVSGDVLTATRDDLASLIRKHFCRCHGLRQGVLTLSELFLVKTSDNLEQIGVL
jgi:hypothetical protein